jgi:hypothetical protein
MICVAQRREASAILPPFARTCADRSFRLARGGEPKLGPQIGDSRAWTAGTLSTASIQGRTEHTASSRVEGSRSPIDTSRVTLRDPARPRHRHGNRPSGPKLSGLSRRVRSYCQTQVRPRIRAFRRGRWIIDDTACRGPARPPLGQDARDDAVQRNTS